MKVVKILVIALSLLVTSCGKDTSQNVITTKYGVLEKLSIRLGVSNKEVINKNCRYSLAYRVKGKWYKTFSEVPHIDEYFTSISWDSSNKTALKFLTVSEEEIEGMYASLGLHTKDLTKIRWVYFYEEDKVRLGATFKGINFHSVIGATPKKFNNIEYASLEKTYCVDTI